MTVNHPNIGDFQYSSPSPNPNPNPIDIRLLTTAEDLNAYDQWVKTHPQGSLWQSMEWKTYQEALGRETRVYAAIEGQELVGSALVVIDHTSFGLSTWDIQRGPAGRPDELIQTIVRDAKKDKCLSLYLSPLVPLDNPNLKHNNSPRHEQPEATRILDLRLSEEELLTQMHPKGRYNIKVAEKHGVHVTQSTDTQAYADLAAITGARDHFKTASARQYAAFLKYLPNSFLLLAHVPSANGKDKSIAGLIGIFWNGTAYYYYGASDYHHRAMMAPYLLQWTAITMAKNAGCVRYDLLGVSPPDADTDHPWKGITSFKEKFGGELIPYPTEQRIVLKPFANALLQLKRKMIK